MDEVVRYHPGGYSATNASEHPGPCDPSTWPTVIARSNKYTNRIFNISGVTNGKLEEVTVRGAYYGGPGGGVLVTNCPGFAFTDCVISGHRLVDPYPRTDIGDRSSFGGGVYVVNSPGVVFAGCAITNNTIAGTDAGGAGIYAKDSSVTVSNCLIQGNTTHSTWAMAGDNGGGIWASGTLVLRDTRLVNNVITKTTYGGNCYGGAVCFRGTYAQLRNVLVSGNESQLNNGDGLYCAAGQVFLENCTVANNLGQGLVRSGGTVSATNCIIWANGDDVVGTVALGWSDIEDGDNNGVNGCISSDPVFEYGQYLGVGSLCVDNGTGTAAGWGLAGYTTRADGSGDSCTVDMGYHYGSGFDLSRANLYVATGGNDSNSGTNWVQAYRTVTKALATAWDGTRIHVATGTYSVAGGEVFPLTASSRSGLQVLGTNASTTVFQAVGSGGRVLAVRSVQGFRLEGVTLSGGVTDFGAGVFIDNSMGVLLSGCVITNNYATGNDAGGAGIYSSVSDVTVSNCLIEGNTTHSTWAMAGDNGGGIWASGTLVLCDTRLVNNVITKTTYGGNCYGGAVCFRGTYAQLRNVLVSGNESQLNNGDGLYCAAGQVFLENCTVANNLGQGLVRGGGTVSATNCIIWANGDDVAGTVALGWSDIEDGDNNGTNGCICSDPLFAYPSSDWHLKSKGGRWTAGDLWVHDQTNSPCIDAGNPASDCAQEPHNSGGRVKSNPDP